MAEPILSVQGLQKHFGGIRATDDLNLDLTEGEIHAVIGPNGAGKTTLIAQLSGMLAPDRGMVRFDGQDITKFTAPARVQAGLVRSFQITSIFKDFSCIDNVALAVQARAGHSFSFWQPAGQDRELLGPAEAALEEVGLADRAQVLAGNLAHGEQRQLEIAMALATRPKVLLLDEPLSALDLKLRQAMRVELKQLQEETGITFIFVTHDQEEALTMSDRIAVMSDGRLQQIGAPEDIYERPLNHFVADFIGETNFLDATVEGMEGTKAACVLPGGARIVAEALEGCRQGDRVSLSVRPEKVRLAPPGDGPAVLEGSIERPIYLGTDTHYRVRVDESFAMLVRVQNAHGGAHAVQVGDRVALEFDPGAIVMLAD